MVRAIVLTVTLLIAVHDVSGAPPPGPSMTRVKYGSPNDYVALQPTLGDVERIRKIAGPLKGKTDEATLRAVGRWVQENLKEDNSAAYAWRPFERIVESGVYGGCADYAIVFASLARACGVPCVFVKTMDADWIYEFVAREEKVTSWRGHVFLEVFTDGKWRLLEPTGMSMYDNYDLHARILPGNRWAYDKGGDARELVLSVDWERWKEQTAAYFKDFDLRQLPISGPGRELNTVYVAADSPVWQAITERLRATERRAVMSFNRDFDRYLAHARGGDLVVTCVGKKLVLPADRTETLLPMSFEDIQKKLAAEPAGVARKTTADGTRVVLVYGRDAEAVKQVVDTLTLDESK